MQSKYGCGQRSEYDESSAIVWVLRKIVALVAGAKPGNTRA